jgi:hypothetical protein
MPNYFDLYGQAPGQPSPVQPQEEQSPSFVSRALDILGRPGRATAGAVREAERGGDALQAILDNLTGARADTFDDVLADQGWEDDWQRRLAGFAGDVVLDPLNFVPVAPALKGAAQVTGLARAGRALKEGVLDTGVGQALAKRFVPFHGLDKFRTTVDDTLGGTQELSYQDMRRLHESTLGARREDAARRALDTYQDINPAQAYELSKALDTGAALTDPRLEAMRLQGKQLFDEQFAKEVAADVLPADSRVDNYVTHLMINEGLVPGSKVRALAAKHPFTKRGELTFEQGAKLGLFEKDIRRITAQRLARGDRAVANAEFFDRTAKYFGKKASRANELPLGWREVTFPANSPLAGRLKGIHFPEEIANDLEKLVTIPEQPDGVAQLYQGALAMWKGYATRANPGFHVRNGISNMLQTWMGGLGDTGTKLLDPVLVLAKHAEANQLLRNPDQLPAIGNYSPDQIRQALKEFGVIGEGSGSAFNELEDTLGAVAASRMERTVGLQNPLLRAGAKVGSAVENTSRLALFLDQLEKGATLEQAALHVRKYLFDYSELTPFEKGIRNNVMPFYTWMRKNIPLQIDNLLTQPDKVAVLGKAEHAIEDATEDRGFAIPANAAPAFLEDYTQLPVQSDGGGAVFVNPRLPIQDLDILDPVLNPTPEGVLGTVRDVASGINPLLRTPAELMLNREFYTNRPVYNEQIGPMSLRRADPVTALLHEQMPGVLGAVDTSRGVEMPALTNYLLRQLPSVGMLGRALPDADLGTAEQVGVIDPKTLSLAGLSTQVITPQEAAQNRKFDRRDDRSKRTALRKQNARIKKTETRSLYQEWLDSLNPQ